MVVGNVLSQQSAKVTLVEDDGVMTRSLNIASRSKISAQIRMHVPHELNAVSQKLSHLGHVLGS